MHRILWLSVVLFCLGQTVQAGQTNKLLSGQELLDHCVIEGQLAVVPWGVKITTENASAIVCHAYLAAVNDAHHFQTSAGRVKPQYCIPPRVALEDFATLFLDHARDHPPAEEDAGAYVLGAYRTTFPCGEMTAPAAYLTGSQLLQECGPLTGVDIDIHAITANAERNRCLGYLSGFVQASRHLLARPVYCLPPAATEINALIDTVVGYLQANPDKGDHPAGNLIHAALTDRYPCGN